MPRRAKGARLFLVNERKNKDGSLRQRAVYVIRDIDEQGERVEESTGFGPDRRGDAETKLAQYIAGKNLKESLASVDKKHPDNIPIAEVLQLYATEVAPHLHRPLFVAAQIGRLLAFWAEHNLSHVSGRTCGEYYKSRGGIVAARNELAIFRAAVNYHREQGHTTHVVTVKVPPAAKGRQAYIENRALAAKLIRHCWRYRQAQRGQLTERKSRQHIAKFVLVGLYTGSRSGAICAATFEKTPGYGWIDLRNGLFYRRPEDEQESNKRKPTIRIPLPLLGHLRRWRKNGQRFAVEWRGEPVTSVKKGFRHAVKEAGLPKNITPHSLRHTAATWMMQAGTDMWDAQGFLGMSRKVLEETYGHHHPDYQQTATTAFARIKEKHKAG